MNQNFKYLHIFVSYKLMGKSYFDIHLMRGSTDHPSLAGGYLPTLCVPQRGISAIIFT